MNPDLEYKKNILDPKSASFCGAKWYNATIWLGSGMTTSCHHPLPHFIQAHHAEQNPKAIHNTPQKKEQRLQMQNGDRPQGCEYCWKIEDMGPEYVSDRVYKSKIYTNDDLIIAKDSDHTQDFDLQTLEIAFDRTCNLGCSYCNPAFSTSWVKDLKTNGGYKGLVSDGRNHFTHEHESAQLYKQDEYNPYVEAFFKWWESDLKTSLQELRITGGEPMMAGELWRLMESWDTTLNVDLAVNSNLCGKDSLIDRFIDLGKDINNLHLYTSCEAVGYQAEYIRDGLEWDRWLTNAHKVCDSGVLKGFHMMCTVNALCLDSLPEFLSMMLEFKDRYGKDFPTFTLNILRFPSFQSPLVLPQEQKRKYKDNIAKWLDANNHKLHAMEENQTIRLIEYLESVDKPHSETFEMPKLLNDFKKFYSQYDTRRGHDFRRAFPNLSEWYQSL